MAQIISERCGELWQQYTHVTQTPSKAQHIFITSESSLTSLPDIPPAPEEMIIPAFNTKDEVSLTFDFIHLG